MGAIESVFERQEGRILSGKLLGQGQFWQEPMVI